MNPFSLEFHREIRSMLPLAATLLLLGAPLLLPESGLVPLANAQTAAGANKITAIQANKEKRDVVLSVQGFGFDPEYQVTPLENGLFRTTIRLNGIQWSGGLTPTKIQTTLQQHFPDLKTVQLTESTPNHWVLTLESARRLLAHTRSNTGSQVHISLAQAQPTPSPMALMDTLLSSTATPTPPVVTPKQTTPIVLPPSQPAKITIPAQPPATTVKPQPVVQREPERQPATPTKREAAETVKSIMRQSPYEQGRSLAEQVARISQSATSAQQALQGDIPRDYLSALSALDADKKAEARRLLEAVVDSKKTRHYLPAHLELIRLYLHTGEMDDATRRVSQALERWPQDPELLFSQGVLEEAKGQGEKARSYYLKALAGAPDNILYHYRLAMVSLKTNHPEEAEWELRRILLQRPDDVGALKGLGFISQQQKDMAAAESYYRQALRSDILLNYAALMLRQNKNTEALAMLNAVDALEPENPDIQYNLGMMFADLNEPASAKRALNRFIALIAADATDPRFQRATERIQALGTTP